MISKSPYSGVSLRLEIWHFLTGKIASAVMTFVILLWIVRLLPVTEYGVYVTVVAALALAIAISGLGLPWLAARYLPDYRLHASGAKIQRLARLLLIWLAVSLAIFTGLLGAGLPHYLSWTGLTAFQEAATLYLLVLYIEGIGRLVIVSLLSPLMQQRVVRSSLVLRQLMLFALLLLTSFFHEMQLVDVVRAELVASFLVTSLAIIGLWKHLASLKCVTSKPDWEEPRLAEMWRTSLNMYIAYLLTLLYSPQVFQVVVLRALGAEAAAIFGFLRSLYVQVAHYLPAALLFNLIRPKLVASFVGGGGIKELGRNANMAGKLSLFGLMPLIVFAAVGGADLISWLSGARFTDTGFLFLGFMLALIPFSQRQLMESMAVATGHAALCPRAAASGLLMPPLMMGLLNLGLGLWAPIIALALGHLLFNLVILFYLARYTGYRPDVAGFYKLITAAVAGFLGTVWLPPLSPLWLQVLVHAAMVMAAFLFIAWLIKPFAEGERDRINCLIKRPLFIW